MAKVLIQSIKCRKPQEQNFFSNGDEVWVRLEGTSSVKYSPDGGKSTWQMVAGRTRTLGIEVEFDTIAELEVWDDDSAASAGGPVEERDNELLATWTFFVTDEMGADLVVTLNQGPEAGGAIYKMGTVNLTSLGGQIPG